jgi:transposase
MQPQTRQKKYTFFIGTDISRNKLDHVVMKGKLLLFHREIKNDPEDIDAFLHEIKAIKGFTMTKAVFAMEQTGIYCNHLLNRLQKVKANVVVDGALQIRNSLGNIRGKNDKLDAIRIAEYAYKCREDLRLWIPKRQVIQSLSHISVLRSRLLTLQGAINTPLKEQALFVKKGTMKENVRLCSRSASALKADISEIESCIATLIEKDEQLNGLFKLVTSVPCVGPVTAVQILICTNEFRDIRCPKKFACYAGVAPFVRESGTLKGKSRVSHMANKKMKALLHTCALLAIRTVPDIKVYYERKTVIEGKHKMLVLNAIRNKLILRVFACVNQNRLYQKDYVENRSGELKPISDSVYN